MSTLRRNTTIRDRHRGNIARTRPPCALCGEDIDYTLPWYDPRAFVVDHILPLTLGGPDTIANKQAAHLSLIHISEPTRLGMISYAVFCLKKKKKTQQKHQF